MGVKQVKTESEKFDRKEYMRQYYQNKKSQQNSTTLKMKSTSKVELITCVISYLLFICISINAINHFSTGLSVVEVWLFFCSTEVLIFLLSFTINKYKGVEWYARLFVVIVLTIGLNLLISKGSYDRFLEGKDHLKEIHRLNETLKQFDESLKAFQQREMHSKAVEILKQKLDVSRKIDEIVKKKESYVSPENQIIMILMRFVISLLNISVIKRIGQIVSEMLSD